MMSVDVVIIGGGINGCASAADAALRGLSVLLCEQDDLASKTSSNSSKLIHGGLRYLEHFDFSLVKKALDERQRLHELAPHLVQPLPFVLPHAPHARQPWLVSLGLFLYDHLSLRNKLPRHQAIRRTLTPNYFTPLTSDFDQGFLFYDCKTDDARLVLANALQAKAHGAQIMTNTKLIQATPHHHQWRLILQRRDDSLLTVQARAVINATGPWVESVARLFYVQSPPIALVQGSHLVVPKLYEGEHAYLLQDSGHRIVFVIPYQQHTLIGTTETPFDGDPQHVHITQNEIDYLRDIIQRYFHINIAPQQIISTFSGVRTLIASAGKTPTALSRDYAYQYTAKLAPLVNIFSGKITTYRELANHVINALTAVIPHAGPSQTHQTPLPGACFNGMPFSAYKAHVDAHYAWLDPGIKTRYLATYGARTENIIAGRHSLDELGQSFGATLYQAEVDYLIREEWVTCVDDILWRRTKLGFLREKLDLDALHAYVHHNVSLFNQHQSRNA